MPKSPTLQKWGVGLIFLSPAVASLLFRDPFLIPKLLPLSLGVLLLLISNKAKNVFKCELDAPILIFLGAMFVSTGVSVDPIVSLLGPHQGQFHALLPVALYALTFYAVSYSDLYHEDLALVLLLASIPIDAYALVQYSRHDSWIAWSIQNGRSGSTFGSPIFLGAFAAMVIPVSWHWSRKTGNARLLGLLAMILAGTAIIVSKSRGGAVAGLAGFLVYGVMAYQVPARAAGAVLSFGAAIVAFLSFGRQSSDICRLETYRAALTIWKANPILGSGPDTFGLGFWGAMSDRYILEMGHSNMIQMSAHNDLLQVLATMGLLGLAAYVLFLVKAAHVMARSKGESVALAAALSALFVQAKFNPVHFAVLAIGAAFLGSLDRECQEERNFNWHPFLITLSAGLVGVSVLMNLAEFRQQQAETQRRSQDYLGSAQSFNRAAWINRWDIFYTQKELDSLWLILPLLDRDSQVKAINASIDVARRACRLHGNDPTAHELLAHAWALAGILENADLEMGIAIRLAPKCIPYREFRNKIRTR